MISQVINSTTIPILQEVIGFAQARHGILAGNVANMDTPGYRVRDLSLETFQARLKEAIQTRHEQKQPISPGIVTNRPDDAMRRVHESLKSIEFHDGSNVGMEQQVIAATKNQFMHNVAIAIMTSQFRTLQAAVSERV